MIDSSSPNRTPFETRSAKSFGDLPPFPGWLREPHFPLGRCICVDGRPGIGKGLLATNLAAQVLREGGDVLWFTAEDHPEEDLHRRLLAAGWDKNTHGDAHFYDGAGFYMPETALRLMATMRKSKRLGLMIMDPGRTYLRNPETRQARYTQDEDMRPGLQALNMIAAVSKVPILFIHHWNRSTDRAGSERFSGSGAFDAVPRMRVTLAWDDDNGVGAYGVNKTNVGKRDWTTRGYRVDEVKEINTARFVDTGPLPVRFHDDWVASVTRAKEVALTESPREVVEWYLSKHFSPGDDLPSREAIAGDSGISQMRVRDGLAALKELGKISQNGSKKLKWTPDVSC